MCDIMSAETMDGPTAPGDQQHNFLNRVTNLPLVHSTIDCVSSAYVSTKESNRYVHYAFDVAERGVTSVTETAKPIVNKLEGPIANVDRFACNQLDKLESKVPLITQPTETVIDTVKTSTMDAVHTGTECWNSSKVGKIVNAGVDRALTTAEGVVDYYLPDDQKVKVDIEMEDLAVSECNSDDSDSVVVVPHEKEQSVAGRVTAITDKVYHRAYLRMLTNVHNLKKMTDETVNKFNDNLTLMVYVKDANNIVHEGSLKAQEKLKTAWNNVLEMSDEPGVETDPNETNIRMVERRTLTLARLLAKELKTSSANLISMVTVYIPQPILTQIHNAESTLVNVYTSFTEATSLEDIPVATLNRVSEQMNTVKSSIDTVADYVVASAPFKWVTPNYEVGQLDPYWQEAEIEDELNSTSGSSPSPPRLVDPDQ